jgi:drug/metabolite transporter (DMT)-like permease
VNATAGRFAPPSRNTRDIWIGLACLGLIVAIWSGFQIVSRFSARGGMNAADLTALRFGVSGVIMLPWLLRDGLRGVTFSRAVGLAATGGLGFSFLAFVGFMFAPANHAGTLMSGAQPLFTALAAALLIGERLGPIKWLGLALIVGGVAAIGIESYMVAGLGYWRGDLCFLGAALCWALFAVACRAWNIQPMQGAVVVCTFSMFAYIPAYLVLATPRLADVAMGELILQAVYQGVLATIVTMLTFTRAVAILGAATTMMMTAAVPGIVTLAAAPLLGEIPSPLVLGGVALVTLGVIATVLTLRPAQAKP